MATRREKVILTLEDNFTSEMARAAAATKVLDKALNDLDGSTVGSTKATEKSTKATKEYTLATAIAEEKARRLRKSLLDQAKASLDAESGMVDLDRRTVAVVRSTDQAGSSIDKLSGRLRLFVKTAAVLGPTLAPIGAVGAAGVAALAAQAGFAAVGLTSVIVAFQGVGTALEAVNKAHLDPTVENLQAAQEALRGLDPAAQAFVARFQEFRPVLADIRNSAQAGFFPGLTEALDSFERIAPKIGDIMEAVGAVGGNLIAEGAEALAGPEWGEFMDFIAREAPPALEAMGRGIGNIAQGMAHLWMAFDPLSDGMSRWLLDGARGFNEWSAGLSKTEGFQEFIRYVQENGPKVGDAFVAIANAVLQIAQAAAPLGGPILDAITNIANAIALIADSPLGTPIMAGVAALSAMSLAANIATAATVRLNAAMATLGVTSRATAASAATATGATAVPAGGKGAGAGGIAAIAALIALPNIPGEIDFLKDLVTDTLAGEKSFGELSESVGRFVVAMNPAGQVAQLFGVDILGVDSALAPFAANTIAAAKAQAEFNKAMGETRLAELTRGYGDIDAVLGRTQRAMRVTTREQARAEAQAESLAAALEEQKAQVQATADQWTDYSQKVQLGETSVDQLMNRWDKLGTASANMADNIRESIREGLDPKIIKDVIDTLGPQGAALALEQFANASGKEAARIERSFRRMSRGVNDFEGAYDGLAGLVSGNGLSMGVGRQSDKIVAAARAARAAIMDIPTTHSTAIREAGAAKVAAAADRARAAVSGIPATSDTQIRENGAAELAAAAARARAAVTSIPTSWTTTIRTVRVGGDTAGGPPALRGADGMTVPGPRQPYGDKVFAFLAPGEEVISNRYGQADQFRADRAAGRIPRYADGGTVQPPQIFTRGRDNETDRESRETARGLKRLRAELKAATEALEKERKQRDALVDKMKTLGSDVSGGLRSELFGERDVWSEAVSPAGILRGDLAEARQMREAIRALRSKGLTGPALAEVLSQGGLEGAKAFADMSRAELREYSRLYLERNRVLRSVGELAGNASFGGQLRQERREFRELRAEVIRLRHAVERNGKDDRRDHKQDRDSQRRGAGNGRRNQRRD